MFAKIVLPLLVAVTLLETPFAAKCKQPFTCMLREECQTAHQRNGGLASDIVLFRCNSGRRSKRVCCPELPKDDDIETTSQTVSVSVSSSPSAVVVTEEDIRPELPTPPPVMDIKNHVNYGLLPSFENCGHNALDKLKPAKFEISSLNLDDKVIGGEAAIEGAYPWMTILFFVAHADPKQRPFHKCGGTLINSRYVLTAAHCFNDTSESLKYVRFGEHDYTKHCRPKLQKFCPRDVPVEKIIPHDSYNRTSHRNDIALLRLSEDVLPTDNPKIGPICLPFDTETEVTSSSVFKIAGWGKLKDSARVGSEILQEVTIQATGQCSTCPKDRPSSQNVCPLSETLQLCVQVFRINSPCKGDSGGPLMSEVAPNHVVQVGVISFMPGGCGETGVPAIYTRVDGYLDWILDNIRP